MLQHWVVSTRQKKSHITSLLKLLKHYQPVIDYSKLPATAETLIYTDGNDIKSYGQTIALEPEIEINEESNNQCEGL